MNYVVRKDKDSTELAQYLHACAFCPPISTFVKCIKKGNFITWPGIDGINFTKLVPNKEATSMGHLDQERKNLRSTKLPQDIQSINMVNEDHFPTKINEKTNEIYYLICDLDKDKNYMDLTGRFPYQSSRGNNYVFCVISL